MNANPSKDVRRAMRYLVFILFDYFDGVGKDTLHEGKVTQKINQVKRELLLKFFVKNSHLNSQESFRFLITRR